VDINSKADCYEFDITTRLAMAVNHICTKVAKRHKVHPATILMGNLTGELTEAMKEDMKRPLVKTFIRCGQKYDMRMDELTEMWNTIWLYHQSQFALVVSEMEAIEAEQNQSILH
jgi:hypothetical protein